MKKLLAVLLVLVMVFGLFACSEKPEQPKTDEKQETPAAPEAPKTDDNKPAEPAKEEKTFDGHGRHITIGVWWDFYYDSTHESLESNPSYQGNESDVLGFENVKFLEEKYNVTFEYVNLTYTGVKESVETSILAGTPDCDIYLCELQFGVPAALNGLACDLRTILPADADILTDQNILSYLDLGDNKVCLMKQVLGSNAVEATYPLAFNMQLLADNGLEDPRELYARNEWTWDKFVEYCKVLTQDTNGDGVNDQYGFTGLAADVTACLFMSNGATVASGKTEGFSSPEVGEALDFYAKLYNEYNVCEPYVYGDNGDVMRFSYRNGNIGFWPSAAWIADTYHDYDWDGSNGGNTVGFDTAYVQWPVGPSGSKDTNKSKLTAGAFWFIPASAEDPELLYNFFQDLSDWYKGDVSVRDDIETLWWWYASTASDETLQYANFNTMFEIGKKEQFDLHQSLNVWPTYEGLIDGTMTASQVQEAHKQEFQAALDAYFG